MQIIIIVIIIIIFIFNFSIVKWKIVSILYLVVIFSFSLLLFNFIISSLTSNILATLVSILFDINISIIVFVIV